MGLTVLLLGATGETGKQLLRQLLAAPDVASVVTLSRRSLPSIDWGADIDTDEQQRLNAKLDNRIVNFDTITDSHSEDFKGIGKGFCCLGTTRAKAGKEGFIRVDHQYVLECAQLLKANGCEEFHLMSSKGADPNSWFLYPSVKGRIEEDIRNLGFKRLAIYRPGVLICQRQEQRLIESWAQWLLKLIDTGCRLSAPVASVARSMLLTSRQCVEGTTLLAQADIMQLANTDKS